MSISGVVEAVRPPMPLLAFVMRHEVWLAPFFGDDTEALWSQGIDMALLRDDGKFHSRLPERIAARQSLRWSA